MEDERNSKSGFVAVLGRPNVGKSTLVNSLIGQKIAAVTPRPQTTRKRQMGILTIHQDDSAVQAVFIDTPGIHNPKHKLGERMNEEAAQTLGECDVILLVVDASLALQAEDQMLVDLLHRIKSHKPMILALNKIDLIEQNTLDQNTQTFTKALPEALPIQVSALDGKNLETLLDALLKILPSGAPFFPEDQTTDLFERDLAADLIRAAALNLLRDEVPHGIAIRIDQYLEREDHGAYIEATIFLERESHKPIVIGKHGSMLKKIGTAAREEIEAMSGRKVFLQLNVKIRKNWRDDEKVLRQFGY